MVGRSSTRHVSFVLLAEFDIDTGANLTRQFPQPLGVANEQLVAELMIPDGVHGQQEDWTVFMLNQTPESTVEPVIADTDSVMGADSERDDSPSELLHVLNLVRTKHDKNLRRGAVVKALALCTRHPFIQLFKPVLWIALQEYFNDPSDDCITRLYDAVNAMDISHAPMLSRYEKLILRASDRKDAFAEKFVTKPTESSGASEDDTAVNGHATSGGHLQTASNRVRTDSLKSEASGRSAAESSASATNSTVWASEKNVNGQQDIPRARSSLDDSSNGLSSMSTDSHNSYTHPQRIPSSLDTHFFESTIVYKKTKLSIRLPLATFPEEVGDYSLIQLIQTFSSPGVTVAGPLHSHLHTNGTLTHPIILLFNALVTGKRIIFLGHGKPASLVANYVLAACALGSGCGCVFRGFTARAFPYVSLAHEHSLQSVPDFIAGVTNPIFESLPIWDVLCNIETGRITVNKDIRSAPPPPSLFPTPPQAVPRSGNPKSDGAAAFEDDGGAGGRAAGQKEGKDASGKDFVAKSDNPDNLFMEDIISAISYHFGESLVRTRLTEYALRFARIAARYEEEFLGSTSIGYPSYAFEFPSASEPSGRLGSGLCFPDEVSPTREMLANASRIEGWRHTKSYEYFKADFQSSLESNAIQGFDLAHQLWRMRHARNMPDLEADLILRTLVDSVQTYEQIVELLSNLPPHAGGLLPLSFGLFHQQEYIRDLTVELLTTLRAYPIGVQFLQSLNHFHKYAYVRQAHAREARMIREPGHTQTNSQSQIPNQNQLFPPSFPISRTPSNHSETSLSGG